MLADKGAFNYLYSVLKKAEATEKSNWCSVYFLAA